jgi:hypothetical protein
MRKIIDSNGLSWQVEVISRAKASAYLNPKVSQPIVQFTCLDRRLPHRYAALSPGAKDSIDDTADGDLIRVFERARPL